MRIIDDYLIVRKDGIAPNNGSGVGGGGGGGGGGWERVST